MSNQIVYNTEGMIVAQIPEDQDVMTFYSEYPQEFRENLSILNSEVNLSDMSQYKVIDGKISHRDEQEIWEIRKFGRVLSDNDRALERLKPPHIEIQKAENTIEILSLLQEVM